MCVISSAASCSSLCAVSSVCILQIAELYGRLSLRTATLQYLIVISHYEVVATLYGVNLVNRLIGYCSSDSARSSCAIGDGDRVKDRANIDHWPQSVGSAAVNTAAIGIDYIPVPTKMMVDEVNAMLDLDDEIGSDSDDSDLGDVEASVEGTTPIEESLRELSLTEGDGEVKIFDKLSRIDNRSFTPQEITANRRYLAFQLNGVSVFSFVQMHVLVQLLRFYQDCFLVTL